MKNLIKKKGTGELGEYLRERRWEYQARDLYYNDKQKELIRVIEEMNRNIEGMGREIVETLREFENCSYKKRMEEFIKDMVDEKEKSKKS